MKNKRSFKLKLWLYFVLFTALIFIVLWLLQTVFLQNFYNDMLISNIKTTAEQIEKSCTDENFGEIIDRLSLSNSILIYITDSDANIIYSSDQFKGVTSKNHDSNGKRLVDGAKHFGSYRNLPDGFGEFLFALSTSENGTYENTVNGIYTYGKYILSESQEKYILYIKTTLDAVGATVDIIRVQLIWGTALSLITGFILSWFIARSFARPVAMLTKKAEHIGEENFSVNFQKGFCSELDELNDVLDETSRKLKQSRTFQSELLANVSHDLRTPLTMIKGYAEMVRDISRTDEEQCHADIEVIIREADRLSAMVNEILEYSEMQSAETQPAFEKVDFSGLVRRVCGNFQTFYSRENGHIQTDIQDNIKINGNAGRLERAVYNLLDNAVRHNSGGHPVEFHLYCRNGQAILCITDHGTGIPEEERKHIWNRYYTYRQRDKKGVSGLGLAIVRQIVEMHKGLCTVESTLGQGSTFSIVLHTV